MTLLGLGLTCVISLFCSLIFSTTVFQRKTWNQIYISLSFFFVSSTLFFLFIGHFFVWYDWIIVGFLVSFSLIAPSLFGIVWEGGVRLFNPAYSRYYSLAYCLGMGVLAMLHVWEVLRKIHEANPMVDQFLSLEWASESLVLYPWLLGLFSILFIMGSLFLWLRKQGNAWIWFSLSGLLIYLIERLASQVGLTLFLYALLSFVLILLIYQGSNKLVNIE